MLHSISLYIPPLIMAVLFVVVMRFIIVSQNPQKRAASKARELAAEREDSRFSATPADSAGAAEK